jgi:hypothetical protein
MSEVKLIYISTLRSVIELTSKFRTDARIISSYLLAVVGGGDGQAQNPAEVIRRY